MARFKILFSTAIISSAGIILGCASTSEIDSNSESAPITNQLSSAESDATATTPVADPAPVVEEKTAAETDEAPKDEHIAELKDKNKVVCRREKLTGSRFPRRICMTVAQREEMARESQQWLRTGGFDGNVQSVQDGLVDPNANRK